MTRFLPFFLAWYMAASARLMKDPNVSSARKAQRLFLVDSHAKRVVRINAVEFKGGFIQFGVFKRNHMRGIAFCDFQIVLAVKFDDNGGDFQYCMFFRIKAGCFNIDNDG
jgi:hypothetical protein